MVHVLAMRPQDGKLISYQDKKKSHWNGIFLINVISKIYMTVCLINYVVLINPQCTI